MAKKEWVKPAVRVSQELECESDAASAELLYTNVAFAEEAQRTIPDPFASYFHDGMAGMEAWEFRLPMSEWYHLWLEAPAR